METTVKTKTKLSISSPSFKHEGLIPKTYTCEGTNISPPLVIEGIPEENLSLAIIMDDPDAPGGTFNHWLVWNIPPVKVILENSSPAWKERTAEVHWDMRGHALLLARTRYFFKYMPLTC